MDGGNYMSSNGKVKEQWDCVKEETLCEFQWPAKNYACNFCKREFKSAQALGGHMNVHRRDRARMRLLPSWVAENSYPNPSFSLPPTSFFPPNFRSSNNNSLSPTEEEKKAAAVGSCSWNKPSGSQDQSTKELEDDDDVLHVLKKKKKSLVSLELKMGILEGSNSNEDLDLELRL